LPAFNFFGIHLLTFLPGERSINNFSLPNCRKSIPGKVIAIYHMFRRPLNWKKRMSKKNNQETINEELLEEQNAPLEETPEAAEEANAAAGDDPTSKVEQLQKQNEELKDKYIRLVAEFENFKKRNFKEKLEMMKNAAQDTMSALLPVLDDFDRAAGSPEGLSEGVLLIHNKLKSVLENKGLKPMESTGEAFDPELHEAVTEIPAPSEDLKGKVVDTIEKGYQLNDKIIRHAKVVVGK
jgi:molecular chaperone GrpE